MMAERFVALGCDVVLWDINGDAVQTMAKEFKSKVECKAYTVDLSSRDQIYKVIIDFLCKFYSIE
jgi:short-subunit dehydrogenase